jgi:hypothetical protein
VFVGGRLPEDESDYRMVRDLVQRLVPAGAANELQYRRLTLSTTAARALNAPRFRGCSNRQLVLGLAERLARSGTMGSAEAFAAIDEMLTGEPVWADRASAWAARYGLR